MIGQTISRYRLEEELGEGGMGVVYRALDLRLGRTVAFKTLRSELAADLSLRRRMATEAQAASALNHPVIATLFDFEADGDVAFLVYEYVKGATLRDPDSVRSLSLEELIAVFITIADGLASAHQAGIVHRDLKPENVMIAEDGRVKILDFGLAKLTSSPVEGLTIPTAVTTPGLLLGTLAYMSPEQLEGEPVDQRTDIFTFGTMLYELTAKHHPFAGKSPSSTIGNILKEEPPDLSRWLNNAPVELDRVIRKCVRKNKEERYQSFPEVVVDLKAVVRDLNESASKVRATRPLPEVKFALSPAAARFLFLTLQCLYLAVYVVAIYYTSSIGDILERLYRLPATMSFVLTVSAMVGMIVRFYFLLGVGLNHPAAPGMFRQAFPLLIVLDAVWAASPLLLWDKIAWGTLICVAAMAPLPFSQRTLMLSAYPKRRGLSE
ncbi:MAG TPA: serine/threonine-protein kinase [Terriglobia bacterium]|nr:serine/threonine-protein kinase [Terriglobia bacterium]